MPEKSKLPNILFILIDDMGWKDLGCYGSDFYETPNIDKLAEEGMLFSDAYAAAPVCSPTRASILSGKYPANVGVTDWIGAHSKGKLLEVPYVDHLPLSEKSLASILRDNGYRTWHIGKWHLGQSKFYPEKHGFDINIGGNHRGRPYRGFFSPYHLERIEDGPKGEYLTDRLTDEAINLIENCQDDPFFLNMSHYAVHTPIQAKKTDIRRFRRKALRMGLFWKKRFKTGEHFPQDAKKMLRVKRRLIQSDSRYAAMVYNLDWNIGRLLKALDESDKADNTIVIFTSDNGGLSTAEGSPTCNFPLSEGKGWMYEGGVREPLIVKWQGKIKAGSTSEIPVNSPDFYPTILEMAGLELMPKQHEDGESILPVLMGEEHNLAERPLFWHYPHYGNQGGTPGSSIRVGRYKLIEFFEDNRLELYDLKEDVGEEKNLSEKEPEITRWMHEILRSWRKDVGARIPKRNEKRYMEK